MSTKAKRRNPPATLRRVVGVVADGQTYKNIAYLLLSFPLGAFYLVFFVAGVGLGVSLSLIFIGIPLLLGVLYLGRLFAEGERRMAERLLGLDIERPETLKHGSPKDIARSIVTGAPTWASLLFLFVKFVLGVGSFVLVVTLGSVSLSLIGAPLYYNEPGVVIGIPGWIQVETLPGAVGTTVFGLVMLVVSFHVFNLAARISGRVAETLLEPVDLTNV